MAGPLTTLPSVTEKALPDTNGRMYTMLCLPISDPDGALRMVETFGDRKGVVRMADTDSPGGAQFSIFTVEGAQEHFGEPGKVDSISIAAPGAMADNLLDTTVLSEQFIGSVVTGSDSSCFDQ